LFHHVFIRKIMLSHRFDCIQITGCAFLSEKHSAVRSATYQFDDSKVVDGDFIQHINFFRT
tara:strand:+ start:8627 stop:8809 length:183 start_codon:yes stop_codon:yes gene_type:complete